MKMSSNNARKIKLKMNHYLQSGWIFRPMLRKYVWKGKKIVLGDNNKRFACWGWETVDVAYCDYIIDFRNDALPFPDGSVCYVFSSHVIEHLPDEYAFRLFTEVHRILKPKGTFRIVCPDMDKIIDAYLKEDIEFFHEGAGLRTFLQPGIESGILPEESLLLHNNLLRTFASYGDTGGGPISEKDIVDEKINSLNKHEFVKWCVSLLDKKRVEQTNVWGHMNAYDYSKLDSMLRSTGFSPIFKSAYRKSKLKVLRKPSFDLEKHDWISLYVEAIKGGIDE